MVDAIQGDAKELLGETEIHIPRLEKRVGLKKKERELNSTERNISRLYFRNYSENKRTFFLHISNEATLTSLQAKVATPHILLKDIIVRAFTDEKLKCCSINNLKCCMLHSYKQRYEPTERDVQLQSKRI